MTASSASRGPVSLTPRAVEVTAIERELTRLWQEAEQGTAPQPVTRACMSNLIIVCVTDSEAGTVAREIGDIVALHPARVLLLIAKAETPTAEISAYVSAQCHVANGGRQICSEHVAITATGSATRGLPSVARPLLVGDLLTTLWWAAGAAPPQGGPLFHELADMVDQVVYDSRDWGGGDAIEAARGIVATAEWAGGDRSSARRPPPAVSDLSWRCLKPWRRLISQALDPAVAPGALESIRSVQVEYGVRGLPQAWLLLGWLAVCLAWELDRPAVVSGLDATWALRARDGPVHVSGRLIDDPAAETRRVTITWDRAGQPLTARFEMTGPGRLTVSTGEVGAPTRGLTLTPRSWAGLVARQLPRLEHDARFRRALAVACQLACALRAGPTS